VGRRAELSQLNQAADDSACGRSWAVLIEGGAGAGKTELLRRATAGLDGFFVLRARCDPAEAELPFGLVSQLLWQARCHSESSVPPALPMTPDEPPAEVGAQLLEFLHAAQLARPLTLVMDDLQWADRLSASAIGFVLRRLDSARVLTLLAARSEIPAASGWTDVDPASDWRRLIGGRDRGRHIWLPGLQAAEVGELAQLLGRGPVSLAAAERIRAYTEGNPAQTHALLTSVPSESLASPDRPLPVPASLTAQVGSLLPGLPEPSARLLAAVAVLDAKSPLSLVARVGRVGDAVTALEPLLKTGVVQWWPEDPATPVQVRRPILRDAIYQVLTPRQRRELHLATASIVHGDAVWEHRVAATAGPDPELAGELVSAAGACLAKADADRAATLLLWAADLSEERSDHERRLLAAAAYLVWCHRADRVERLVTRVTECGPCALRDLILVALSPAGNRCEHALALLEAALSADTDPWRRRAAARAALAVARDDSWRNDDGSGSDIAERVLAIGDPEPELRQVARCLVAESAGLRSGGVPGALEEFASVPPDPVWLWRRGALRVAAGELADAAEDLAAALSSCPDSCGAADASASVQLAYVQYLLGTWQAAAATAERAGSLALRRGTPWSYSQAHAVAACIAAGTGNWAEAEQHLSASKRWWRDVDAGAAGPGPALAEAALAQARGDYPGVLAALGPLPDEPAGDLHQGWRRMLQAEALIATGRLGEAASALAGIACERACLRTGLGWLSGWLACRRGDQEAARTAYEEALTSPVTPNDIPLLRARLEHSYGQLRLAQHNRREAISWLRRAYEHYTALGAGPFAERCAAGLTACGLRGADPGATPRPAALSAREHLITSLVAQGMTNHEVARELYISVKTVEYHLSNIFIKLGITSRRQLRASGVDTGATAVPGSADGYGTSRAATILSF
jgi:DNA-binding CsgD family transcriptional regulator